MGSSSDSTAPGVRLESQQKRVYARLDALRAGMSGFNLILVESRYFFSSISAPSLRIAGVSFSATTASSHGSCTSRRT